MICRQEHLTILTFSFVEEIMRNIGYSKIRLKKPVTETDYPDLFQECLLKEHESDFDVPHTLIVEGVKPIELVTALFDEPELLPRSM